jgi:polar amino acid transport system ATP-binding protein
MTARPMVEIRHVTKRFGTATVLDDITLDVPKGSAMAIIGPSGSGKTTLIQCINHLLPIDRGRIHIDGRLLGYREGGAGELIELPERKFCRQRADIGMVFQHFNLFHNKTAIENVMEAPMMVRRVSRAEAHERAALALESVGLARFQDAWPSRLSGGQQQRVAIARALAMRPGLMLFDEPTSMLDPELVGEVLSVMRRLVHSGITMIFVTHELGFAREACDALVFMDGGKVIEQGPPARVIDAPLNERTREFVKRVRHITSPTPGVGEVGA